MFAEGAGEGRFEVGGAVLLEDDLLALVGLSVGGARGLGVGEVLGGDVHADAFGAEAAAGDVDRVEEAHQARPAASGDRLVALRGPIR